MKLPSMSAEQINQVSGLVAAYINTQRQEALPNALPLTQRQRTAMDGLIHVGAFNISLVLRKMLGSGKPRELKNRAADQISRLIELLIKLCRPQGANPASPRAAHTTRDPGRSITLLCLLRWTKAA
jgi:hypothetical protein